MIFDKGIIDRINVIRIETYFRDGCRKQVGLFFIAFDLFKRNYSWPKPLRSIGVRGADLCPADCAVQLGFFSNEEKREKLEHIDKAVDTLRQRYGYRSVQRAVVYTDPVLGGINAYDDHNIHPVGYFHTA